MLGLKPWEYYAFDSVEYSTLLKGYDTKDQIAWDKFRTVAYYAGAADFKNLDLKKIKPLPMFDGDRPQTNWERFREILERSKKQKGDGG